MSSTPDFTPWYSVLLIILSTGFKKQTEISQKRIHVLRTRLPSLVLRSHNTLDRVQQSGEGALAKRGHLHIGGTNDTCGPPAGNPFRPPPLVVMVGWERREQLAGDTAGARCLVA